MKAGRISEYGKPLVLEDIPAGEIVGRAVIKYEQAVTPVKKILIVKWVVKAVEAARIRALLPELIEKSRAEKGNELYTIYQSESDPNAFFVHECYADADAVEAHRQSEHYQRIVAGEINPRLVLREVAVVTHLL